MGDAVGAGLHRHQHPDYRCDDDWANQHTALVAGIWWWIAFPVALVVMTFIGLFLLAVSMNEFIDPRSRLEPVRRMNILTHIQFARLLRHARLRH